MRRNSGLAVSPAASTQRILFVLLAIGFALSSGVAHAVPVLVSASNSDDTTVVVEFSENIDPTTGNTTSNYFLFETANSSNVFTVNSASTSGTQVTLGLGSALSGGVGYTLRVQNVENTIGEPIAAGAQTTFTATSDVTVIPIATIQANPTAYEGQSVTVEGIVYIPTDYRGATVSGYIQDSSDRGINIFGNGMDVSALQTVGNRVRVTGTVEIFFTTVEITTPTEVSLLESGLQRPAPAQLTTGAAANSQWEGTFIEVVGTISARAVGGPGVNYTVNDGSGPIVVRVVDSLGAPAFSVGQTITARGAGGAFGTDFQVNVGLTSDVFTESPAELAVSGASAGSETSVLVEFNKNIDSASASDPGSYTVYPTGSPGSALPVTGVSTAPAAVTLTVSPMSDGVEYTVEVQDVEDSGGQPIGSNNTATFTYTASNAIPIATIQANPGAYEGQTVTVEGIVYIPTDYRGSTVSGYIQDSSDRGINIFGNGMDVPALTTVGNRVRVTGTVELYFTTVEITTPTEVTLLESGLPRPAPAQLTTGAGANSQWEGTFIEVNGSITAQAVGGPGVNYTVNDGSGPIVVRVVDNLGAPSFTVGQTITARGAGGAFGTDFQVNVGLTSDVFLGGGGPDITPPQVTAASAASQNSLRVNFSEALDPTTAQATSNYRVFETASPSTTLPVVSAVLTGVTVVLDLGSTMADGTAYTVEVSNVEDLAGNVILAGENTASFVYSSSNAIPIAQIQADPASYEDQSVTIEAVVYIPTNYRGTTTSGYVQDESNRGINIFGSGMNVPALTSVGNRVRITGTVEIFFTTVEITNPTEVTLLSSGSRPGPEQLSTGAAANSQWEGTFIEIAGDIVSQSAAGGGTNYSVNDGSGGIVVRVVDTLGAPSFSNGTFITARGAGGQFGADYQVNVGLVGDVFAGSGGDLTPPRISRASLESATSVIVDFNETVTAATAGDVGNYTLFRTGNTGISVVITSANVQSGTRVQLALAESISLADGWTVNAVNVEDVAGNAIQPPGVFKELEALLQEEVDLAGPPYTFLPREGEFYPLTVNLTSELANDSASEVLLRIFDINGSLLKTLYDSRIDPVDGVFNDNRATFEWDGQDDYGEWVAVGAYVAYLTARVRGGDAPQQAQIPVVVATRLDR